jgi:hypothetical protein
VATTASFGLNIDTTQSPEEPLFTTQVTLLTTTPFNVPTTSVNFGAPTTALSLMETEPPPPLPPTEAALELLDLPDVMTTAGFDDLFDIATPAPTFPDFPGLATTAADFPDLDIGATLSPTDGFPLPEVTTEVLFTLPEINTEGLPDIATTAAMSFDFGTTAASNPTIDDGEVFICDGGQRILSEQQVCDSVADCVDGSDESPAKCPDFDIIPATTAGMFLPTVLATTAGIPIFEVPATTQTASFEFPTTNSPPTTAEFMAPMYTTQAGVATTAINMAPETTAYPQFQFPQTTAPFPDYVEPTLSPIDYPDYPDVDYPTTSQPQFVTTAQATISPPITPPMAQNQGNPQQDYVAFRHAFLQWRSNVFNRWIDTARSYQEKALKQRPQCDRTQGRTSCRNNRRECKEDLRGCLYCYCRIDERDLEDKELVYSEYEKDVEFWNSVLEVQWLDMFREWQEVWDDYQNDPDY